MNESLLTFEKMTGMAGLSDKPRIVGSWLTSDLEEVRRQRRRQSDKVT